MARRIESLSALPENQGQLLTSLDGVVGAIGLVVTNIRGLGTERLVSDFSFAWLPWDENRVAPGMQVLWDGGRFLVVKVSKSGTTVLSGTGPQKAQVLPLVYDAVIWRAGVQQNLTIHFVPQVTMLLKSETEVPLDKVSLIAPLATPVQINDLFLYDGWWWFIRNLEPETFDGHEYARRIDVVRYGKDDGSTSYIFTNATVTRYREDKTDPAPITLRCRWYEPTHDRLDSEGEEVPTAVFFADGADITQRDVLSNVLLDRPNQTHAALLGPDGNALDFIVDFAAPEGAPLAVVRVQLSGGQS